MTQPDRNFYHI